MNETVVNEIIDFVNKYDKDLKSCIYNPDNLEKAKLYLKMIRIANNQKNAIYRALFDKLNLIVKQINLSFNSTLDIISIDNISEYIISLIKEKNLTDTKLIARYAYIELSKYLYYNISYSKTDDLEIKRMIVDTPIDVKTAKIFSYIVCTQWLQLYKYILSNFGITVKEMHRPFEDHIWGEITLNNGEIIIADATDYISSSIDLSNAKSVSPTKGFIILPSMYSGIKFQEIYTDRSFKNILNEIIKFYDANKELDISLGYINSNGYPIEKILKENDLFKRSDEIISNQQEADRFIIEVQKFLSNLHIPNNMDGYEIFAYYHSFIKNLPKNIRGNISMKTLYVNTFEYKQSRLIKNYLKPDEEYLKYLEDLLSKNFSSRVVSSIKNKENSNGQLVNELLKQELQAAEINKRFNLYYAINELRIYNPFSLEPHDLYQLYEPTMGKKTFHSLEEEREYKKLNRILV